MPSNKTLEALWKDTIHPLIHDRLLNVRPKLKDHDAVIVLDRCRKAVIEANDKGAVEIEDFEKAALEALPSFNYRRGYKP